MARTKGSANIPKTIGELEAELAKLRGDQGDDDDDDTTPEQVEKLKIVTTPPADQDSYQCGACGQSLDSERALCPYCGAHLIWS